MSLQQHELYRFDEFTLDRLKRTLLRSGLPVVLSPKAYDVLSYLVMNPGRVVSKEELLKAVWPESFVEEGNLTQHISILRKALGDRSSFIVTIPGRGYQFSAPVTQETAHQDTINLHPAQDALLVQTFRERAHFILEQPVVDSPASAALAAPSKPRRWLLLLTASLAVVAALGASAWWYLTRPKPSSVTVVLADIVNTTGDTAFDRTLKRAMEIELQQSPYMDVMSERIAINTLHLMGRPDDTPISADVAREICERTNRQVVLTGSITTLGRRYLITLDGADCRSGKSVVAAKAEAATKDEVLQAVDSVAAHVRRGLNESSSSLAKYDVPLGIATTPSLEALRQFSLGRYLDSIGRRSEGRAAFLQAVQIDPQFALAYYTLAGDDTYFGQDEQAAQEFAEAFRLSDRVSENERVRIRAMYYSKAQRNIVEAIKAFSLWAATYPHDPAPLDNLTDAYMSLGQYEPALEAGKRDAAVFPNNAVVYENLASIYRFLGRFDEAKAATQQAARVGTGDTGLDIDLFEIALAQRDDAALARESAWFDAHDDGATVWYYPPFRGGAAAAQGRYQEAEKLYRRAYDGALRANLPEAANVVLLDQARSEWNLGYPAAARATLQRLGNWKTDTPDLAELQAQISGTSLGEAYLAAHGSPSPDTLMTYVYVPRVRAALALQRHAPADAIQNLEPTRLYERRDYAVPSQRAAAYVALKQFPQAISEYLKISSAPGIAPDSVLFPMAQLGLARAYASAGDAAHARHAYETLFQLWKNADPDLPVLKQAHAEYARLAAS